jgi:hypothetical protein
MPRSSLAEGPAGIVPMGAASIMAATAMMLAIWAYGQATAVSELQACILRLKPHNTRASGLRLRAACHPARTCGSDFPIGS